ncbi:unnamed protein product [Heterosigma akashiwo]
MALYSQSFRPNNQEPKGLMLLCHGYAETSLWYFRDIAMDWVKEGYACVALDYEGHGKSDGLHAYIPDFDKMVDDVAVFHEKVAARPENAGLPRFLHGESMGGAVAIELSLRRPQLYQGMVLQAPMCKISEKVKPPAPIIGALRGLARIFPERAWTPSRTCRKSADSDPGGAAGAARYTFAYSAQGPPGHRHPDDVVLRGAGGPAGARAAALPAAARRGGPRDGPGRQPRAARGRRLRG